MTPNARVTVVTMGNPSGIAATARLTFSNNHIKNYTLPSSKYFITLMYEES